MRIISQNRKISVNFDRIHLYVEENKVMAKDTWTCRGFSIGEYNSTVRAMEVFEKLNKTNLDVYYMPEK